MASASRFTAAVCLAMIAALQAAATGWPVFRDSAVHRLGHSYGQYQCFSEPACWAYMHTGIDIMVPPGTPVYTVKSGYVKAVLTTSAPTHWRVVIGDSAGAAECDAWMYAHINQETIPVTVGQWVEEGDYLGDVVNFTAYPFQHLHFSRIRHSGASWDDWANWRYAGNPLDEIDDLNDPDAPVFENAFRNQIFAFCRNYSASYFGEGAILDGDVDIICRVYDYINHYDWIVAPHEIQYRIEGDSSIPWTTSVCFTGPLNFSSNVQAVYQDDDMCDTQCDYTHRQLYFSVANTNGDSVIEFGDRLESWKTAFFHNGEYTVSVKALDRAGNSTTESMVVTVENFFTLSGTVTFSDGNPYLAGTIVSVIAAGQSDTTDELGDFSISDVGGGSQPITVTRKGYETADTVLMMSQHQQLDVTMIPGGYICGDGNLDDRLNILDATFLINYLYKDGPEPYPAVAVDVDGSGSINLLDVTYLINYLYKEGPLPDCP